MPEEHMKELVEEEVRRRVEDLYKKRQAEEVQTRKLRDEMERGRQNAELKARQLEAEFKANRALDDARLQRMQEEFQSKRLADESSVRTQINQSILQEEAEVKSDLMKVAMNSNSSSYACLKSKKRPKSSISIWSKKSKSNESLCRRRWS